MDYFIISNLSIYTENGESTATAVLVCSLKRHVDPFLR